MEFESLNAADGAEGQRQHEAVGSPVIPTLVVDGQSFSILHPSQIASILDLPRPEDGGDSIRLAWDTVAIIENWMEILPAVSWGSLLKPTLSRGRSVRNLTVNTFRPFELLPEAWRTHRFDWYTGEEDAKREREISSVGQLKSYAQRILSGWEDFLMSAEEELAENDPVIQSNRGDAPYSTLLRAQRWHAAFHHRQIVDFLRSEGLELKDALYAEGFRDIGLPEEIY